VLAASDEPLLAAPETRARRLVLVPAEPHEVVRPPGRVREVAPEFERRRNPRPREMPASRLLAGRLAAAAALLGPPRLTLLARQCTGYGLIALAIAETFRQVGPWAIALFALPMFLLRRTEAESPDGMPRATAELREAAVRIQTENASLEQVNRLLRERSTAAMESLSATVDARDAHTAGHSRRVQRIALAVGSELGLSRVELELLGQAALFHDIGKLGIPDSILLKPKALSEEEWVVMAGHADVGAAIINRLGFLSDAVPAIRHHHERFDGQGYPDGLVGEEIPLGARIIHVADALDSMRTTRAYKPARSDREALEELRRLAGSQFCPRCVAALEAVADTL